jgi:hypothetical protein
MTDRIEEMQESMDSFNKMIEDNVGVIKGVKYNQDTEIEVSVRALYLREEFGEEKFAAFLEKFGSEYDLKDASILENSKWNEILGHFKNI